ncbi:ABC transporter substrate-binding protein [bacterium]|nr:ABC transporter substrate-binding protein [bacterium]
MSIIRNSKKLLFTLIVASAFVTNTALSNPIDQAYGNLRYKCDDKRYKEALELVDQFRKDYPGSKHEASVTLIAAEASLGAGMLERCRAEAKRLQLKFSDSSYIDDSYMILARCDLLLENWNKARENLNWIIDNSGEAKMRQDASALLNELTEFQKSETAARAARNRQSGSHAKVGLVLPLSGSEDTYAQDFLSGFNARISDTPDCDIIVYDSYGDPVRAVRLARRLTTEDKVRAIVGGLEPEEAAALAAVAEADKVPFISTSCRISDLTSIGRYVFQGRINYVGIGAALAKLAFYKLELADYGILAPISQAGRQISEGFKQEIAACGGTIITEEAYYPGTRDVSAQLKRIRKVGLRKAYDDSMRTFYGSFGYILADSNRYKPDSEELQAVLPPPGIEFEPDEDTTWTLTDTFLDSLWIADHERLNEWMTETREEIDSLEIPLTVYDGFLLVIEPGAIEIIAPQFTRYNLKTQLLGDENWADSESHYRVKNYINGMVYAEPMAAVHDSLYYLFSSRITGSDNTELNSHHLEGERAACMIQYGLAKADGTESMRLTLSQIRDVRTLTGTITLLKEERVDRRITLKRFIHGEYEAISE